jgi:hypothetical protein
MAGQGFCCFWQKQKWTLSRPEKGVTRPRPRRVGDRAARGALSCAVKCLHLAGKGHVWMRFALQGIGKRMIRRHHSPYSRKSALRVARLSEASSSEKGKRTALELVQCGATKNAAEDGSNACREPSHLPLRHYGRYGVRSTLYNL